MAADDPAPVLAANAAFYAAFAAGDVAAVEACWSRSPDVAVIHPGWPAVHGRDAVIESFRQIFDGESPPNIECAEAAVYVSGAFAFVICTEHLEGGDLVATNLFVLEGDAWKMVHHQAGPQPARPRGNGSPTVH